MFVISQTNSYKWPVTVEFPSDGGKTDKQTFEAEFKRLSQSRIEEIRKLIDSDEITDRDFAREVLVGWSGIVDGTGDQVPFSPSACDQLLDVALVSSAIALAFMQSLSGVRRKNSLTPPSIGRAAAS